MDGWRPWQGLNCLTSYGQWMDEASVCHAGFNRSYLSVDGVDFAVKMTV